ncbi:MAG: hypothetical protein JO262_07585 [Solirubrobacterales bacterium]|nr:hypothetical protein [Solirubrobacterales bacterium]
MIALLLAAAPGASASTPSIDIHSVGPLSDIYIGNDLSCQVRSGGFSSTEYFPDASGPGDCGTLLYVNRDDTAAFFGPDFANHAGGTHTTGSFSDPEVPFTPVSQSFTGSGTATSPYRVTTVASAVDRGLRLTFTEVDTYAVGSNFFQTDVTVSNISARASQARPWQGFFHGELYHAADCLLHGSDTGFGAAEPLTAPTTGACTVNRLGSPASAFEEFVPITPRSAWIETASPTIWSILTRRPFGNTCSGCNTFENNAQGIEWPVWLEAGQSRTFSFQTKIVDTVPTGGLSLSGTAGNSTSGTVATITDPNTSATAGSYSATINWGDGTTSSGTITGGNGSFSVAGAHVYATSGRYSVTVTITAVGTSQGRSTVDDSVTITAAPSPVITGEPPSISATTAAFIGSVDPNGLPTTAFFEYGLDPKYLGAGPLAYTQSTPVQSVGGDFSIHTVSASVTGLVPNALYHARLVATNSAGTTVGPDITFTTPKTPPPAPPTIGKTFTISPVRGIVLILLRGQLVPLTGVQQIPQNTLIDARRGTLKLTTAVAGASGPAHDAAAEGKRRKSVVKTQSGTFGGAIFKIAQAGNGLVTLSIVENAFKGAPSYATCKARKLGDATAAAVSGRTLQLLHASAKGRFRTRGRYSAATVRGTIWTIADRCDGTLTHDITDSVAVIDFVRHKTIILHRGQRYLAAPRRSGRGRR